jgi:hypothetical protein
VPCGAFQDPEAQAGKVLGASNKPSSELLLLYRVGLVTYGYYSINVDEFALLESLCDSHAGPVTFSGRRGRCVLEDHMIPLDWSSIVSIFTRL